MNARDVGIGLVLGALVGLFTGVLVGRTPAPPVAEVAVSSGVSSLTCPACPACPAVAEDADAEMLAAQQAQIHGLSQAAFGTPLPWPSPAVQNELAARVSETLADCGPEVEVLGTDCSEPPCLVALNLGAKHANDVKELCPTWRENLGLRGYHATQKGCPDGSVQNFAVMYATLPDIYRDPARAPEAAENEQTRDRIRKEDLAATFACR